MPAGDGFTYDQQRQIERARERARDETGLPFHVYVGPIGSEPRVDAQRLHRRLPDSPHAVLVAIDPRAHVLEIVTGAAARRILDDKSCALTAMTMQTLFEAGDLVGGIVRGLYQLGDHARQPETLHTDQA